MITQAKAQGGRNGALPNDTGLIVGIVHGTDGVLYVAAARSRAGLFRSVATWAVGEARVKLRGEAQAHVEQLHARGVDEGTVRAYLRHVASRWEAEWLTIQPLPLVDAEPELPG